LGLETANTERTIFVGGDAATVSPAGGYVQGAEFSEFSPIFGLAADNVLLTWFDSGYTFRHESRKIPEFRDQ
jgi:hypothetical protein